MKTCVDQQLQREAETFRFRFQCDDCAHFDDKDARCSHGYPCAPHRSIDLGRQHSLVFCKEFELR